MFAVVRSGVAAWGSKFDQVTTWRTIGPPLVRAEINAGLYPLRVTRMLYEQGVLLKDSDFAAKDLDARVAFNGKMTEMDAKAVVSGVARLDQKEITEWVSLRDAVPKDVLQQAQSWVDPNANSARLLKSRERVRQLIRAAGGKL